MNKHRGRCPSKGGRSLTHREPRAVAEAPAALLAGGIGTTPILAMPVPLSASFENNH